MAVMTGMSGMTGGAPRFGKVYRVDAPTRELAEKCADRLIAEKARQGVPAEKDYAVMPAVNGSVWIAHDVVVFTDEDDGALSLHRQQEALQAGIISENVGKSEGRIARMMNTHPQLAEVSRKLTDLLKAPVVIDYGS